MSVLRCGKCGTYHTTTGCPAMDQHDHECHGCGITHRCAYSLIGQGRGCLAGAYQVCVMCKELGELLAKFSKDANE